MTEIKPITFLLREGKGLPFTGVGGVTDTALEVTVECHNSKAYRKALYFRNVFATAFMAMASKQISSGVSASEADEEAAEEGLKTLDESVVRLVLIDPDIDAEALLVKFDELMQMGVVKVNDKPINYKQVAELDPEDAEDLLVVYISNFITPLVMRALGGAK